MAQPTREEIQKRITIEETRITNTDQNISALVAQRGKSQDELSRLYTLLEALPEETTA